ncbi:MAG TPA: hemolysin III family protein [Thermoleophilaceae bacterium]|nr:hemolysin III family protein [Thermoleophilaceae bacterium]
MAETAPRLDLEQAKRDIGQALRERPRWRGVTHQWAFFISLALGVALVVTAPPGRGTLAAAIYAACVTLLFGASALYHRVTWQTDSARRWMRRLDHSAIFLLIAGTYTPFALLVLHGSLADVVLAVMWSGAVGGILLKLLWIDAPKRLAAVIYVALGFVAVAVTPELISQVGVVASILVALGGVLYTLGAVTYALRRPDPVPAVFGYHEVFHALVIVAAALQYAVIAFWVLPQG